MSESFPALSHFPRIAARLLVVLALSSSAIALAQSPEDNSPQDPDQMPGDQFDAGTGVSGKLLLHLPMDGSFENRGSLPGVPELVIRSGGAQPQFVDGAFGQALRFDGKTVLAVPVDLTNDDYRTVTLTGWVRMNDESKSGMTVLSTGTGLRVQVHQRNISASPGGPLYRNKNLFKPGEWSFMAVVYDMDNNRVRVQKDTDFFEHRRDKGYAITSKRKFRNPNEPDKPAGNYLFIGGKDFSGGWAANNIEFDDLRLYAGALTDEQLGVLAGARQAAQANCNVADISGDYRTRAGVLSCRTAAASQLACSYGPNNANNLDLQVNANVTAAAGTWSQPSGLGGPAEFDIDASCALTNGRWGMAGGSATNPWDSDGVIARIGTSGSDDGGDSSTSSGTLGGISIPQSGRDPSALGVDGSALPISEEEWAEAQEATRREAERREREAYQTELSRQQNELERQRREAEAAAEAEAEAAAEATTIADAGAVVRPVPIGDAHRTSVSGYLGDDYRTLDLDSQFLRSIQWDEASDVPCTIRITGGDSEANRTTQTVSGCDGGITLFAVFSSAVKELTMPEPNVIEGLAVCSTFNRNNRLKGIRVVGGALNADGTTNWELANDLSEIRTNCSEWHDIRRCNISTTGKAYAATGIRVHFNHRSSFGKTSYEIVGLSLICREIGLR